jgi:hypothetical protein
LVKRHPICERAREARVSRVQEGKEESEREDKSKGDTDGEFNAEAPKYDGVTTVPPSSPSDAGEYEGGVLCPPLVATALKDAQCTPEDLYYEYGWVCRFRAAVLLAPLASAVCKASCVVLEAVLLTPCFVGPWRWYSWKMYSQGFFFEQHDKKPLFYASKFGTY